MEKEYSKQKTIVKGTVCHQHSNTFSFSNYVLGQMQRISRCHLVGRDEVVDGEVVVQEDVEQ